MQQHPVPMSQWSREDLQLILASENGGAPHTTSSSGRNNMVLDSKHQFKNQIRKLDRQQRISRSFEQLVELTEPECDDDDDDEHNKSSLPAVMETTAGTARNVIEPSNTAVETQQSPLVGKDATKHEPNVDDRYRSSYSGCSASSDSSANDIRFVAVHK